MTATTTIGMHFLLAMHCKLMEKKGWIENAGIFYFLKYCKFLVV